jgi:hypothetical protein
MAAASRWAGQSIKKPRAAPKSSEARRLGEGAVQRLDIVEVRQAGQVVAQGLRRQVAFEHRPAQVLGLLPVSFGLLHVDRSQLPGRRQRGPSGGGIAAESPATVRRRGPKRGLERGARLADPPRRQQPAGRAGGEVGRALLLGGRQRQPQVQVAGPVRQPPDRAARRPGAPDGGRQGGQQATGELRRQGVVGGADPASVVLRMAANRLGQGVERGRIFAGGRARQRPEVGRRVLEGEHQFATRVLHARRQAAEQVEPGQQAGEGGARIGRRQPVHDHAAVRLKVPDQLPALAPGDADARRRERSDALVDLRRQPVRPGLGRQLQPQPALQVGVADARLGQQLRQARRAEPSQIGRVQAGRGRRPSRHLILPVRSRPARGRSPCPSRAHGDRRRRPPAARPALG